MQFRPKTEIVPAKTENRANDQPNLKVSNPKSSSLNPKRQVQKCRKV